MANKAQRCIYILHADTEKSGGKPNGVNEHGGPIALDKLKAHIKSLFPDAVYWKADEYEGYEDGLTIEAGGVTVDADLSDITFVFANTADSEDGETPAENRIGEIVAVYEG